MICIFFCLVSLWVLSEGCIWNLMMIVLEVDVNNIFDLIIWFIVLWIILIWMVFWDSLIKELERVFIELLKLFLMIRLSFLKVFNVNWCLILFKLICLVVWVVCFLMIWVCLEVICLVFCLFGIILKCLFVCGVLFKFNISIGVEGLVIFICFFFLLNMVLILLECFFVIIEFLIFKVLVCIKVLVM